MTCQIFPDDTWLSLRWIHTTLTLFDFHWLLLRWIHMTLTPEKRTSRLPTWRHTSTPRRTKNARRTSNETITCVALCTRRRSPKTGNREERWTSSSNGGPYWLVSTELVFLRDQANQWVNLGIYWWVDACGNSINLQGRYQVHVLARGEEDLQTDVHLSVCFFL